jgi:predicted nucleic acid-binding protein
MSGAETPLARIYWDSNLFIYLFEEHPLFAPKVRSLRSRMIERGDQLFTSAFAVGEILVKPAETGQREISGRYLAFFRHPAVTVIPFELECAARYASIRGDRSIRPADAIHLACAATAGIDLFITNDDRLLRKTVSGIDFLCGIDHLPL